MTQAIRDPQGRGLTLVFDQPTGPKQISHLWLGVDLIPGRYCLKSFESDVSTKRMLPVVDMRDLDAEQLAAACELLTGHSLFEFSPRFQPEGVA